MQTLFLRSDHSYLTDNTWWGTCTEPKNIVQFNIGLFATLLATAGLEVILCAIQMINGLFGCLCGTCAEKGVRWSWAGDRYENTFSYACCEDTLIQTLLRILTSHLFFFFPCSHCDFPSFDWRPLLEDWEQCSRLRLHKNIHLLLALLTDFFVLFMRVSFCL